MSPVIRTYFVRASDSDVDSDQTPVAKVDRCMQEVFNREHVRQLVLAYNKNTPLSTIREQLGPEKPWEESNPMLPAPRVPWIANFASEQFNTAPMAPPTSPASDSDDDDGPSGGSNGGSDVPPGPTAPDTAPAAAKPIEAKAAAVVEAWMNKDILGWLTNTDQPTRPNPMTKNG